MQMARFTCKSLVIIAIRIGARVPVAIAQLCTSYAECASLLACRPGGSICSQSVRLP
jgi:hypothetical protein